MIILRGENGGMGIKKNTLIFRWIVGGSKTTGRPFEEWRMVVLCAVIEAWDWTKERSERRYWESLEINQLHMLEGREESMWSKIFNLRNWMENRAGHWHRRTRGTAVWGGESYFYLEPVEFSDPTEHLVGYVNLQCGTDLGYEVRNPRYTGDNHVRRLRWREGKAGQGTIGAAAWEKKKGEWSQK